MNPVELLNILGTAEKLKCRPRHCVTSTGRPESVAEHSWRLAFMSMLVRDEFPEADMDKVLKMCIIHDLGEAFTGDIPAFDKTEADRKREKKLLHEWISSFPHPYDSEFAALLEEMDAMQTEEVKIYKALDNLEAVIQHDECDISTWLPLEYDLQLEYGKDKVQFSPYMKSLKAEIDKITLEKIADR